MQRRWFALITFCLGVILWTHIGQAEESEGVKPNASDTKAISLTPLSNQVPFLSTYYIPPKVDAGKEIHIDYYVTDYDQREYRKNDQIVAFAIDYWVNGVKTTLPKIKAGEQTLTLAPLPKGEVLFALQATDKQGRKSRRIFQKFWVVDPTENPLSENKILHPDLKKFNIYNDDTHPVETTKGLTEMLKWAGENGYLKVVLPGGTYRLDENHTVQMASHLTLDMNGAIFKLNPHAKDKCLMLEFIDCKDSHVVNGTFEGDSEQRDDAKVPHESAGVDGISLSQGSEYCTVENVTVKNIAGRGVITNHGISAIEPKKLSGFVSGDLDEKGQSVSSEARMTTGEYLDITDYIKTLGFIQLGDPLKAQGIPEGNWVYRAHFFDASKKYLETIEGYFYGRLYLPAGAAFAKFTILSKAAPEALFVFNISSPSHCAFIGINHQNIRSAGMALNGYENLLVENCSFNQCGKELLKSAFIAADGLDLMQNLTLRNNQFQTNPHEDVTLHAGHNSVLEGNIAKLDIGEQAHSFVLRNDKKITSFRAVAGLKAVSGYSRVQNNRFTQSFQIVDGTHDAENWKLTLKDNYIAGEGDGPGATLLNCQLANPTLAHCEIIGGTLSTGDYTHCHIHDMHGNNRSGRYRNCTLERISGNITGTFDADNCVISDWDCSVPKKGNAFVIKNSEMNGFVIRFNFWLEGTDILIEGCKINNWDYLFFIPAYSFKQPITFVNNTFTTQGTKGLMLFYHDGEDKNAEMEQKPLTIKNNVFHLENSDYVITARGDRIKQGIKLIFENNKVYPETVLPINPAFINGPHVTDTEN